MTDFQFSDDCQNALLSVTEARVMIIEELRRMATAEERYDCFSDTPLWMRGIWRAAADQLELEMGNKN